MLGASRKRFRLHQHGTLIPPVGDCQVVSFTVGSAGEAVVLWSGDAEAAITVHTSGTNRAEVTLRELPPAFATAQTLPDGRFLVVGSRAAWRDGAGEANAHVYDADGRVEQTACVGDGVAHVQTSSQGAVWVGYDDEGVYGNRGWGMGDGPSPIGEPGVVRFTTGLDVEWEYPRDDTADVEPIDDCYALNVAGDEVWACCYSDFDVVRIRDGAVQSWSNEVEGATAIVVSDDSVALFGGSGKDRDRLVIGSLEDDELDVESTGRLVMPNGRRLPQDAVVVGRGEEIHVLVGLEWFTWSVTDHD